MIEFDCTLNRGAFQLDAAFSARSGITALFGPSGSGKSTILRLLSGLQRADRGVIRFDGSTMLDTAKNVSVPPHRRRIGLVYQDGQLLPHLSVAGNLDYGRWFTPRAERKISNEAIISILGIEHLLERRVSSLSGGEKQRVAIGRAVLASPRLLLMDEPLASLDAARKQEILPFIERLRDAFSMPIVYVSHSAEEVARLAETVVLLEQGRVVRVGPPGDVLAYQAGSGGDRFSALSVLTGTVSHVREEDQATFVSHPAGTIVLPGCDHLPGQTARVAVKATNVTLALDDPGRVSVRTSLIGRVAEIIEDPSPFVLVVVELEGGDRITASITRLALRDLGLSPGQPVRALVKSASFGDAGTYRPLPDASAL